MTSIEKSMLVWFGHVDRMSGRRLTECMYKEDVSGNAGTYLLYCYWCDSSVRCVVFVFATGVLVSAWTKQNEYSFRLVHALTYVRIVPGGFL